MDESSDDENIPNVATSEEQENIEMPPPAEEQGPPAKKKRIRKTKAKKFQVGAKVKKRKQRNYRKEPANVPMEEAEFEEPIFEDQPAYDLEPLPDLPDQSKYRLISRLMVGGHRRRPLKGPRIQK